MIRYYYEGNHEQVDGRRHRVVLELPFWSMYDNVSISTKHGFQRVFHISSLSDTPEEAIERYALRLQDVGDYSERDSSEPYVLFDPTK